MCILLYYWANKMMMMMMKKIKGGRLGGHDVVTPRVATQGAESAVYDWLVLYV